MATLKIKDRVRILVGVYVGKEGRVDSISSALKSIGVYVFAGGKVKALPLTWFRPEEIEKV